jgi:Putative adhesin
MPTTSARHAALLLTVALAGCDVNIRDGKASVGVFSAEAAAEWTHHYPLAEGGLVEIVNVNGPIDLVAGDSGTVEVHASIVAKALTDTGARDILAKGRILESAEPARVHIETMTPRDIRGSYVVRYEVRVPPGAAASVSATSGSLKATGLSGTLKIMAVNGRVQIENVSGGVDGVVANGSLTLRAAEITAAVQLEVTNGSLALDIPSSTKANLSARVVNGSLSVSGLPVEQPTGRRIRNLEAPVNGGGPDISARVTNGRLTITGR